MRSMHGGRIVAGLLIVMAVISRANDSVNSAQGRPVVTPAAQRAAPTQAPLGTPTLLVTITLTDPPVDEVAAAAKARGLSDLEIAAVAFAQRLRITAMQAQLIETLTHPPLDATLVEQSKSAQNTITIQVKADRLQEIEALPGVLSVRVGAFTPPVQETPSRGEHIPGTRVSPPQPPGFDESLG